jgi:hypothetical protein
MANGGMKNEFIKETKHGFLGWSITTILFTTSAFAILNAALVQYFVLANLSGRFQKIFEIEMASKLTAQTVALKNRMIRGVQLQNGAMLRDSALELLSRDSANQVVVFYDSQGKSFSFFQRESLSLEFVKALTHSANLQALRKAQMTGKEGSSFAVVNMRDSRSLDVVVSLDGRAGYARLLASLSKLDERTSSFRFWGSALVIFTTALGTFLFLFVLKKTVAEPIERASALIRNIVANPEKPVPLELKDTDALQVRELLEVVHFGLTDLSLKQRLQGLYEKTRNLMECGRDEKLFENLPKIWTSAKLASECVVILARKDDDAGFVFDAGSSLDGISEEALKRFLARSIEIEWSQEWLFVKVVMSIFSREWALVLAIVPHARAGVHPARLEELSLRWVSEIAKIYQVMQYKSLAGDVDLSRELLRKITRFVPLHESDDGSEFESLIACESQMGTRGLGDFSFVSNLSFGRNTVAAIGTVSGEDFRAGLAASVALASLADRFQVLQSSDALRVLKGLAVSLNSSLWKNYNGSLSASCTLLVFDHENGTGQFVCYGAKNPVLLTPRERKPMLIAQVEPLAALGSSENFVLATTSFPIVPGQIVLLGTQGFWNLENDAGLRFEKHVLGGGLSGTVDASFSDGARVVMQKMMENYQKYSLRRGSLLDATGLVVMRLK